MAIKFQFIYMKSIEELEKYLEDECYSFAGINIGKHYVHEGIVIEKNGDVRNYTFIIEMPQNIYEDNIISVINHDCKIMGNI